MEGMETGRGNKGDRSQLRIKADVGGRSVEARMARCREERRSGDRYRRAVLPIDLR